MARNGKRLGFLPGWRVFTYVILVINLLFLIWIIAGANSGHDTANCGSLSVKDCNDAQDAGTAIGVGLIIVLWAFVDIILGVLWLITNRKKRECPVCGRDVKKGVTQCSNCGHDFRAVAAPVGGGQLPPASWMPDPQDPSILRWWDGSTFTQHTQPTQASRPTPGSSS